jgi:TonB family protein
VNEMAQNPNPDESAFQPPPQAVSWNWCRDAERPRVVESVPPTYPPTERANGQQAIVSVNAVGEADGSLHDLRVVRSAGQDFDAATLTAVARWRFCPAMCGGKPVPFEKVIDVTYALRA